MSIIGTLTPNIKNGDLEDATVVMSLFAFIQSQVNGNAAATGANADITSLAALASINGGPLAGLRNRLMNGNFAVNQRAVSGTVVLAAGAYGHDRWKAGAGGCTYTFAASGNDTVLTISAGSLMQVIEDKNVEGGVYALANRGTATARIAVNGAATSGAYSTASTAVPLASASATGGQTMTVEFSTGTIDRAQLEPGTVATNFERRPDGAELALCQRYYEIVYSHIYFAQTAGSVIGAAASPKVTKRAAPTLGAVAVTAVETNFTYTASIVDAIGNVVFYGTATATGAVEIQRNAPLSAEL